MKNYRKIVTESLRCNLKLPDVKIQNYEKMIYNFSIRISKEDDSSLSSTYRTYAFEKVGQLVSASGDNVKIQEILTDIKTNVKSWDSSIFKAQKEIYERQMDRSILKPTAVKKDFMCKYKGCKSQMFYCWSIQDRSGDEGMTHKSECAACGKRRKE